MKEIVQLFDQADSVQMQFYTSGVSLIHTDIRLGFTFVDMAELEFGLGELRHSALSLHHARRAVRGAEGMLRRLPALGAAETAKIEKKLAKLRAAVNDEEKRQAAIKEGGAAAG